MPRSGNAGIHPVRWRNTQCFDDTVTATEAVTRWGTEYDYMGFLYSLDTQGGPNRLVMNDLFDVFRAVCRGGVCGSAATVAWDDCTGAGCQPGVAGWQGYGDRSAAAAATTATRASRRCF